ncbi:nucleotidyltransferase family protein [Halobacillus halophilus]|uniref:nucleotidyltransferase family protein n=1 Tax=Halobacillus halophilus TaxID=1570 RepID=UPI001CD26DC1|nr:nucleotidyltransferase family protein [Halobacillus halophilus]MCA1010069.1 nucleotidyltransferase family protein [Halobacillus halophilus]
MPRKEGMVMLPAFIYKIYKKEMLNYSIDEYHRLAGLIQKEQVGSQILHLLKQHHQLDETPGFFQDYLVKESQYSLYQNLFIKSQMNKILDQLELCKIELIPIKGVIFGEKYFGHAGARATSDIDLLVRDEQVGEVVRVVKELGFQYEEEMIEGHFHCSLSKEIPGSSIPLVVEIHWNLMEESNTHLTPAEFFSTAEPYDGYKFVKVLSPAHTFYFMCLHAWRHNLDSARHYLDLIQVISVSQHTIIPGEILEMARKHSTLKRVLRTLSDVYYHYPFLEVWLPFPELSAPWYKKNRNIPLLSYLKFFDYQFLSYDQSIHRLREIFKWIIPNKKSVENELKEGRSSVVFLNYLRLYRQRVSSLWRALR